MRDEWIKIYVRKDSYNKVVDALDSLMDPDEWVALFNKPELTPQRTLCTLGINKTTAPRKIRRAKTPRTRRFTR